MYKDCPYSCNILTATVVILFYLCILLLCILLSALQVAFGSLYRDDVLIKPSRVIAILAAACMLQLVSMHITQKIIILVSLFQGIPSKNNSKT